MFTFPRQIMREGRDLVANTYENLPSKGRNKRSEGSGTIPISMFRPIEQRVKNCVNRALLSSIPFVYISRMNA